MNRLLIYQWIPLIFLYKGMKKNITLVSGKETALCFGLILLYLGGLAGSEADFDLWGYLAFGRLFFTKGNFPFHDSFSYMPTKDIWVYHEWLTGVLFYPIYKYLGASGLQLLKYILGLSTVGLVFAAARKQGAHYFSAGMALYLAIYVIPFGYSPVRAQVFTYFFFALSLYIIESSRKTKNHKPLWWLVLIQLLWCNFHGGYVAGLGVYIIYIGGQILTGKDFKPYAMILAAAFLVTIINPYGVKYWTYIIKAISMPRPDIIEWHSVFYCIKNNVYFWDAIFFILLFIISLPFIIQYYRLNPTSSLLLSVTAFVSFISIRHIVFFALTFGVYAPVYFTSFWESVKNKPLIVKQSRLLRIIIVMTVSLFLFDTSFFFYTKFISQSPFALKTVSKKDISEKGKSSYYPADAAAFMKQNDIYGNVLTLFEWGEYIIWNFYPDCHVAIDGRYETVYPDKLCKEYFDFLHGRQGWNDFLDKYPHDLILIAAGSFIHHLLKGCHKWREIFKDSGSVLFVRVR